MATKSVSAATIALPLLLVGSASQSFAFVHHGTMAHRGSIIHHRGVGRQSRDQGRGTIVVSPNGGVYYRSGSVLDDTPTSPGAVAAPAAAGS